MLLMHFHLIDALSGTTRWMMRVRNGCHHISDITFM